MTSTPPAASSPGASTIAPRFVSATSSSGSRYSHEERALVLQCGRGRGGGPLGGSLAACVSSGGGGAQLRGDTQTDAEKAGELNKQLGTEYLRQGNLALAKEKLERAEKYNPRDPEVHSVLAVLYERLGIPKEVDEHYKAAIRLAPKDPQISNNYAVYLCRNGRTDEGVKRFLEAAQNPLYRTPEIAYTQRGRLPAQGEAATTKPRPAFTRALQIRPNNRRSGRSSARISSWSAAISRSRASIIDKYLGSFDATAGPAPHRRAAHARAGRSGGRRQIHAPAARGIPELAAAALAERVRARHQRNPG